MSGDSRDRKIYDVGPTQANSTGSFDGSGSPTTVWGSSANVGILGPTQYGPLWLSGMSQSVNDNGRVGISVAAESLDIKLRITPQPTVVGYQHLRMLIVQDFENAGAYPTLDLILGAASQTVNTVASGYEVCMYNPAFFGRFRILEDKNWYLFSSNNVAGGSITTDSIPHPLFHEVHVDLKGSKIMWDTSDLSAIANARKGHIFMFFIYSNMVTTTGGLGALTTANPPSIAYMSRLRYRDLN